jgi:uncharacterized membrane protein
MGTENSILMQQAKEALTGKWGLAIGTIVVYMLIVGGISAIPFAGTVGMFIIGGPFALGLTSFTLNLSRDKEAKLEQIFGGFNNFVVALSAYLLMMVYVMLWMLLLIVPGIIAALSYSMTFYILADDDTISASDALKKSKQMMEGYKWKYFCLGLRFIGWALLCILTLGIGFLWLMPYMHVSMAKFYDDLKENQSAIDL